MFVNLVLADEINRAPAKVQAALLEVMAERQVTIGGTSYPVPDPFLVVATQNPAESEGVYPLPEAQRDRFLLKVRVDHPAADDELEIVRRMGTEPPVPEERLALADLVRLQRAARTATLVDHRVEQYAVDLVTATRDPARVGLGELAPYIATGVSSRATLGLIAAGRALALLRRRSYVLPQDVWDVAPEVLPHRLILSYDALADGVDAAGIVATLLATVHDDHADPAPVGTPRSPAARVARSTSWRPPTRTSPPSPATTMSSGTSAAGSSAPASPC